MTTIWPLTEDCLIGVQKETIGPIMTPARRKRITSGIFNRAAKRLATRATTRIIVKSLKAFKINSPDAVGAAPVTEATILLNIGTIMVIV